MFVVLKPKKERDPSNVVIGTSAARHRRRAGHPDLFPDRSRTSISAGASPRANISTRCRAATPRRFIGPRPNCVISIAKLPDLRDVTTDLYIKNPQMLVDHRSREGGGLRHHRRPDPAGIVQRLWLASGRDHLHGVERLPGHHGDAAGLPGPDPTQSVEAAAEDGDRPDRAARSGGEAGADSRTVAGEPPGPAARR